MEQIIRLHIEDRIENLRQWKDTLGIENELHPKWIFPRWIRYAEHRIHHYEQALDMLDNQFSQDDNDDPQQKVRLVLPFVRLLAIAYGFIPMYENGERL
jgi:hypothetical protein